MDYADREGCARKVRLLIQRNGPCDAAMLINSAVVATKGDLADKEAVRKAMEKADFKSVRGKFRFGNNHIPIQNFYLQEAVRDGDDYALKTVATIVEDSQDRFHAECLMK
jgi:branched-chain amino acid transport system substrate-binding protein